MKRLAVLFTLSLVFVGGIALAKETAPASSPEIEAARLIYNEGAALAKQHKYADAVAKFQVAYDMTHAPKVLIALGDAQRKGGQTQAAIETYKRYLLLEPTSQPAATVKEILLALEENLKNQPINVPADRPAPVKPEPGLDGANLQLTAAPPPARSEKPAWKKGWVWGVVVGSVAAVALGVGLGVGLGMPSSLNTWPSYTTPPN